MSRVKISQPPARDGLAYQASLRVNDYILKVNDTPVSSPDQFRSLMNKYDGKEIPFTILRAKYTFTLQSPAGRMGIQIIQDDEGVPNDEVIDVSHLKDIVTSTTPTIPEGSVASTVDVISSECVLGINGFKDAVANIRDMVGGRSKTVQNALREAKDICLFELKQEAYNVGADAVVSVKFDYSEISSTGGTMLLLCVTGTAVKIR